MTADVRLVIKPKNARICRAMEAKGFNTVAEMCHALGIKVGGQAYYQFQNLVTFSRSPVSKKTGAWRPAALNVAALLGVEPEELWPEYLRDVEMKRPAVASIDVTVEQLAAVHGSEQQLIDRDLVSKLLTRLPARERLVLEMHYGLNGKGEHTLREIASALGLKTGQGAATIENKAMRRCYAWTHNGKRMPFYDDVSDDDDQA